MRRCPWLPKAKGGMKRIDQVATTTQTGGLVYLIYAGRRAEKESLTRCTAGPDTCKCTFEFSCPCSSP